MSENKIFWLLNVLNLKMMYNFLIVQFFFDAYQFDFRKKLQESEVSEELGNVLKIFCNATGQETDNYAYNDLCLELYGNDRIILGSNQGKIKVNSKIY